MTKGVLQSHRVMADEQEGTITIKKKNSIAASEELVSPAKQEHKHMTEPPEIEAAQINARALVDQTGTRKAVNRRLIQAKKEADKNAIAVKSRIKLLESEDHKILKKID